MDKPIITRRFRGEYSTVRLPDGAIETMWFGDDGEQRLVATTWPRQITDVAAEHIALDGMEW